jgi:hypothetical protein
MVRARVILHTSRCGNDWAVQKSKYIARMRPLTAIFDRSRAALKMIGIVLHRNNLMKGLKMWDWYSGFDKRCRGAATLAVGCLMTYLVGFSLVFCRSGAGEWTWRRRGISMPFRKSNKPAGRV